MTTTLSDPRWLPPVLKVRNPLDLETPPTYVDAGGLDAEPQRIAVHALKTWPIHFGEVWDGRKRAELRVDDRGLSAGDALWLREWSSEGSYTGRAILARITHTLDQRDIATLLARADLRSFSEWAQLLPNVVVASLQVEGRYTA